MYIGRNGKSKKGLKEIDVFFYSPPLSLPSFLTHTLCIHIAHWRNALFGFIFIAATVSLLLTKLNLYYALLFKITIIWFRACVLE